MIGALDPALLQELGKPMLDGLQFFLLAAAAVCVLRLVLGPASADRLVALNVLSGVVLAFLTLRGVADGRIFYLDVALVYDIFGFLGFLALSRFLKDELASDEEDL